ncbi:DUF7526 family protein [Halorarius halobius]|uniref:DUF7526 family protein n=1 Tax=Halorarius halobius TaxID=2962671 RepID=UPI0020CD3C7C|nr:hypothetical protein [Halorarius halobius]
MADRTLTGEVLHVVEDGEQAEYDLTDELAEMAASKRILVVREGGRPSWLERIAAFVRRDPIEAVTVVTASAAGEGQEVTAEVRETELPGVYVAEELRTR